MKDEEENDGKKTAAGTHVLTTTDVAVVAAMEDSIAGWWVTCVRREGGIGIEEANRIEDVRVRATR